MPRDFVCIAKHPKLFDVSKFLGSGSYLIAEVGERHSKLGRYTKFEHVVSTLKSTSSSPFHYPIITIRSGRGRLTVWEKPFHGEGVATWLAEQGFAVRRLTFQTTKPSWVDS